jgi:branched-chain amino acid transport system ATP-binding protein
MTDTTSNPSQRVAVTGDDILMSARNLSVRFGGVVAVDNVSFDVKRGEVFTLIGPNGAGKTTVFNLISRIYTPTAGEIEYFGRNQQCMLTKQPPHKVAGMGIARTFQNIELFEHASVLQNLLIGRHTHKRTGFWAETFFTNSVRASEIESRYKIEQVIELLDLQHYRDTLVAGLPYGVRKVVELARALCTEPELLLQSWPAAHHARCKPILASLKPTWAPSTMYPACAEMATTPMPTPHLQESRHERTGIRRRRAAAAQC